MVWFYLPFHCKAKRDTLSRGDCSKIILGFIWTLTRNSKENIMIRVELTLSCMSLVAHYAPGVMLYPSKGNVTHETTAALTVEIPAVTPGVVLCHGSERPGKCLGGTQPAY